VIGICSAMEPARWSVWDLPAALVPMSYVEQVQAAGGVVLLIPPDPALIDDPGRVLDRLDGLLLVGGVDVEAATYGAEPHPLADPPLPLRDAVETALVQAAAARRLPVLGICRGAQVINVAAGGTLRQHLPDDLGTDGHRRALGSFVGNEHDVEVEEGSRAIEATGEALHRVASHHHQAIDAIGEGLRVTARAVGDGLPEAVESNGPGWLLGVQWHPEADSGSRVIAALVAAAERGDREEGGDLPIPAARHDERS
jgi:putative glutamine amidotransferase